MLLVWWWTVLGALDYALPGKHSKQGHENSSTLHLSFSCVLAVTFCLWIFTLLALNHAVLFLFMRDVKKIVESFLALIAIWNACDIRVYPFKPPKPWDGLLHNFLHTTHTWHEIDAIETVLWGKQQYLSWGISLVPTTFDRPLFELVIPPTDECLLLCPIKTIHFFLSFSPAFIQHPFPSFCCNVNALDKAEIPANLLPAKRDFVSAWSPWVMSSDTNDKKRMLRS